MSPEFNRIEQNRRLVKIFPSLLDIPNIQKWDDIPIQISENLCQRWPNPIYAVEQEDGVRWLHTYLEGRLPFGGVPPFLIDEARGDKKAGVRFHIGGRVKGKIVTFSLNQSTQRMLRKASGIILAIPRQDENNLYQWMDFHELEIMDAVDLNHILQSFGIDIPNLKMESWQGPERQMFLDYLEGRSEIELNMLREFVMINLGQTRNFHIGRINGDNIGFGNGEIPTSQGKGIIFRPFDDHGKGLLEISVFDEDGRERLIDSRIFYKGDHKLYRPAESAISSDEANEQLRRILTV